MNRVLIFFAFVLVCGCQPKNKLKTAIREFAQSENDFEIVSVDTVFIAELNRDAARRSRESAEIIRGSLLRTKLLLATIGKSAPPVEQDSTLIQAQTHAAKFDSIADTAGKRIAYILVKTSIGEFIADSALQKVDWAN